MKNTFWIIFATLFTFQLAAQVDERETELYNFTESEEAADHYYTAYELDEEGDTDGAIYHYKAAIGFDENFIEAYDNLAVIYRKLGMLDEAEVCYKEAIRRYPEGQMAYQNIAIVYEYKGDYREALKYCEKLQEIAPKNPEGFYGAARMLMMLERYDEAIKVGKKAIKKYKKLDDPYISDAYFVVGLNYLYKQDTKNGKKYMYEAIDHGMDLSIEDLKELVDSIIE